MFYFLKRIFIYVILTLTGHSKRKYLVERLTRKTKKRNYVNDIESIPAILDDVIDLSANCRDTISFVGFDKNGLCLRLIVKRHASGTRKASLDLDIPGYGRFKYQQSARRHGVRNLDDEDVCEGLKLKLFCQRAMQRWRIFLRGPMKQNVTDSPTLHSTVSLCWTCLFDPYDYFVSPPNWTRANDLTWLSWRDVLFNSWQEEMLCYEQIGELRGRISLKGHEVIEVRMKCVRERSFEIGDFVCFEKVFSEHLVVEESGSTLSNALIKLSDAKIKHFGCVSFPVGDTIPTVSHTSDNEGKNKVTPASPSSPGFCTIYDNDNKIGTDSFLVQQHTVHTTDTFSIVNSFQRPCFSENSGSCKFVTGTVNDRFAFGLHQTLDVLNEDEEVETSFVLNNDLAGSDCSDLAGSDCSDFAGSDCCNLDIKVVPLENKNCRIRSLAGGKASNLSLLKQFDRYKIPNGICITTNAFREHVQIDSKLQDSVSCLTKCLENAEIIQLEKECSKTVECFQMSRVSNELRREIKLALDKIYGENGWDDKRFAVRSSGESEDGAQLSSAGQMETFLSVHGFEKIIEAIKNCWGSSVSYRTVEYRRQNGQCLVENVAVLVQEMVQSETAGVLFTNDPVTGNEAEMVINASVGLGEAVVSGKVNADTAVIQRDEYNNIRVKQYEAGDKRIQIVSDVNFGVRTEIIPDSERNQACLTTKEIQLICETGITIEKSLGSAQDIEWAISKGELFILQSRPVTALEMETDEELMHEFDFPIVNENLLFTTANVQEALPGALTPLTNDILLSAGNTAVRRLNDARLPYRTPVHPVRHILSFAGVPLFCGTCVGMTGTLMMGEKAKADIEMNFFGQIVEEHMLKTIKDFYGRAFPSALKRQLSMLKTLLVTNRRDSKLFDKIKSKTDSLTIGENAETAKELYKAIDNNISLCNDMLHVYYYKTTVSGIWAQITMDLVKGEAAVSDAVTMADIAMLLSECNDVYSADVPSSLNKLAEEIAKSDQKQEFLEIPDCECDQYLKQLHNDKIRSTYVQFLTNHGHRCIREGEFYMKSWRQDPVSLMKTMKQIINLGKFENRTNTKSIDEVVDHLRTPVPYIKRVILKRFLVRKARNGVCQREFGKSTLIKTSDKFKQAYWKLATMMVCEGRLPDERLLFFLTHTEIGKLIERRSVRLVRLAKRRFKLWPEMNKIKYPKLIFGLPKPMLKNNVEDLGPVFTLTGMPVCLGIVEGKARVIKYVENADEIKEGEILICVFTDVGWSPYFCLICGLVTELGGLISHGAVVARECGIPCVVNVANVTDLIKTGDHIIVDGGKGTVCKIET